MRNKLRLSIGIEEDTGLDVKALMDMIHKNIPSQKNIALDRMKFEKRMQHEGESFDSFYVAVKDMREMLH